MFALSVVLCVISTLGFMAMARNAPRKMPAERVKRMTQATGTVREKQKSESDETERSAEIPK